MQQQVAEGQGRVAQETRRDSNAMKSIALLTMVFLPSTALAVSFRSVISMSNSTDHIPVILDPSDLILSQ